MTEDDFTIKLMTHIWKKYGTNVAAAKAWDVKPQFVGAVLKGKSRPTETMIKDAGYTKTEKTIINYKRMK